MVICRKCDVSKHPDDFGKDASRSTGRHPYCRDCKRAQQRAAYDPARSSERHRAWRLANAQRNKERNREYRKQNAMRIRNQRLLRDYGITLEEYECRLNQQGGVCAICSVPPGEKVLAVDHCHIGGQVRGLLCDNCNQALGKFRDDVDLLQRAIAYLE